MKSKILLYAILFFNTLSFGQYQKIELQNCNDQTCKYIGLFVKNFLGKSTFETYQNGTGSNADRFFLAQHESYKIIMVPGFKENTLNVYIRSNQLDGFWKAILGDNIFPKKDIDQVYNYFNLEKSNQNLFEFIVGYNPEDNSFFKPEFSRGCCYDVYVLDLKNSKSYAMMYDNKNELYKKSNEILWTEKAAYKAYLSILNQ